MILKRLYWYYFLVLIRFLLVLAPQTGYIHPDEYFQSVDVLASKILGFHTDLPWEFTTKSPIRSMTFPWLTVGTIYKIFRIWEGFLNEGEANLITPYLIVVAPRLVMCQMSLLVDWSLYKLCVIKGQDYHRKLLILASSYVMLIYGSRAFSNTIEMFLFALLLYLVTEGSWNNCTGISLIVVFGFFNRPTFICYALVPVLYWLWGPGCVRKAVFLVIKAVPSVMFNVAVDTVMYNVVIWDNKASDDVTFVVTPLNFLKYNMDVENLARNGIHPRYLHSVVNVPLLFSTLALLAYLDIVRTIYYNYTRTKNSTTSHYTVMQLSFVVPLFVLSLVPHQEPRFIIPLLVPLVYLYADKLVPGVALTKYWYLCNLMLVQYFGFLHQGGVYPVAEFIAEHLHLNPNTEYHVATSRLYGIPESLFLQRGPPRVVLHLGRQDADLVPDGLTRLLRQVADGRRGRVWWVATRHTGQRVVRKSRQSGRALVFRQLATFYPHLSNEDFPDLPDLWAVSEWAGFVKEVRRFVWSFGVRVYEVRVSNGSGTG